MTRDLDPQFKSLLKNHWIEESQHAKLDTRMVENLADGLTQDQIATAMDGFLSIGGFLDEGLKQQTLFDLEALETANGRTLRSRERDLRHDAAAGKPLDLPRLGNGTSEIPADARSTR